MGGLQRVTAVARIKVELPDNLPFQTDLPVRITDINYGQHLGHDALLGLLHEARVRYLTGLGFTEQDVGGCGLILVDTLLEFRTEVFYGATLRVDVGLSELSRAGFALFYRVTDAAAGHEVARARTGMVFYDYARRRVARCPEPFQRAAGAPAIRPA
jgi:acyl-CoA thioester hydrolase